MVCGWILVHTFDRFAVGKEGWGRDGFMRWGCLEIKLMMRDRMLNDFVFALRAELEKKDIPIKRYSILLRI